MLDVAMAEYVRRRPERAVLGLYDQATLDRTYVILVL
jgi:hypothetical protein